MLYQAEYSFLKKTLEKCRLQSWIAPLSKITSKALDVGKSLSFGESYVYYWIQEHIMLVKSNTIYRFSDPFGCCYMYLRLPKQDEETFMIIGPYFTTEQSYEMLLTQAEKAGISPRVAVQLREYYSTVPLIADTTAIFAMIDTFGELLFGGIDHFNVVDMNREAASMPSPLMNMGIQPASSFEQRRKQMEERYLYENQLIDAVKHGLAHKAEVLFSGFSRFSFEQRLADPIRNLKNYCIIMNTLLRKAAEEGGVHPLYLDQVSSEFAKKIEQQSKLSEVQKLMNEIFSSYCRLVRRHSMKDYSQPVQRTILHIDSDLSADLSLSVLAKAQDVSPSYLSALFHKETGQTLTEHVNTKRMRLAMQLLRTTPLQIQTIAQSCGILDVHYFSRIFKKYTGKTPKEYRERTR